MRMGQRVLLIALISLCAPVLAYDWSTNPGDGSATNPYQISNAEQLMSIGSDAVLLTKHYILTNDITFDPDHNPAHVFTVALIAPNNSSFSGSLNGNGFCISHLKIDGYERLGLIGKIAPQGQITDLELANVNIRGVREFGGLCGQNNYGTIVNCSVMGSITGDRPVYVGGLCGYNYGNLIDCSVNINITVGANSSGVGCLCGYNFRGTITNCSATGILTAGQNCYYLGGVAGYNAGGSVLDCFASVNIVSGNTSEALGGLVGTNEGTIRNCDAIGNIEIGNKSKILGGLAGSSGTNGLIHNCTAFGNIQANGDHVWIAGGLVGSNGGTISCCYASGSIIAQQGPPTGDIGQNGKCGGLIGGHGFNAVVKNSASTGSLQLGSGYSEVGGFIGECNGSAINCYSRGNITGQNRIGGFAGGGFGSVQNSYSTGLLTSVQSTMAVGAFTGDMSSVSNCYYLSGSGPDNGMGTALTDAQMKQQVSFAGWDFLGESQNGENEIWRMCVDGVDCPRLSWEFARNGDFACGEGVDLADLLALAEHWLMTEAADQTTFSYAADANADTKINLEDLAVLSGNWLQ